MVSRAERLMNLHILLLGARRFLDKEAIRRACYPDHPDTPAGDEAFERAFERDKDSLRQIGAFIEVGTTDAYFDDEVGYRIPTEQTSLPEIRLEADEAAVLGLAAQVWQDATLSRATSRAVAKLRAQGIEVDAQRLEVMPPSIASTEPAFEPLWDAVQKRRVVTFDYHRGAAAVASRRRIRPWGLVRTSGRWYVVGHDVDRDAPRVFRLSRIAGRVRASGKSGAYDVPAGTDVRAIVRAFDPEAARVRAELLVRRGAGLTLRRRAESDRPAPADVAPGGDPGPWDEVVLEGGVEQLAGEVLSHGPDVVVVGPEVLRSVVVDRLRAVVETQGASR
ncbi:MAG: WYL domain-containing protein [Nocardioides sp.]|nr:WYL domain-containing protein [Nocardioides sp.]